MTRANRITQGDMFFSISAVIQSQDGADGDD